MTQVSCTNGDKASASSRVVGIKSCSTASKPCVEKNVVVSGVSGTAPNLTCTDTGLKNPSTKCRGSVASDTQDTFKNALLPGSLSTSQTYRLGIRGMTCGSCAAHIEGRLRELPSVFSANVSVIVHEARVELRPVALPVNEDSSGSWNMAEGVHHVVDIPAAAAANADISVIVQTVQDLGYECWVKEKKRYAPSTRDTVTEVHRDASKEAGSLTAPLLSADSASHSDAISGESAVDTSADEDDDLGLMAVTAEGERDARVWAQRLCHASIFALPVFAIAMILPQIPDAHAFLARKVYNSLSIMAFALWLLATPVMFGSVGLHFLRTAYKSLVKAHFPMAVLVALGSGAAYLYGTVACVWALAVIPVHDGHAHAFMSMDEFDAASHFFETATTLLTIVALGQYLEHRAKTGTSRALVQLLQLAPPTATRVDVLIENAALLEEIARRAPEHMRADTGSATSTSSRPSFESDATEQHANFNLNALCALLPGDISDLYSSCHSVPTKKLQPGAYIVLCRGERVPADGAVVAGTVVVDAAALTGEPVPVSCAPGTAIAAGCIVVEGHALVRVSRAGEDSAVGRIARLVADAQTRRAPISAFADRISRIFVPIIIVMAVATFISWMLLGYIGVVTRDSDTTDTNVHSALMSAFQRALAVLVVACPCALGLATPTAIMVATGASAKSGILVHDGAAIEAGAAIDTVVFDKTGTLTEGRPIVSAALFFSTAEVGSGGAARQDVLIPAKDACLRPDAMVAIFPGDAWTHRTTVHELSPRSLRVLAMVHAAEKHAEHPVAVAIRTICGTAVTQLQETGVEYVMSDYMAVTARGTRCNVEKRDEDTMQPEDGTGKVCVLVGNREWMADNGAVLSAPTLTAATDLHNRGATVIYAAVDGVVVCLLALSDAVKTEATFVVHHLQQQGRQVHMLSGDHLLAARQVACGVGIPTENVKANVTPAEKLTYIEQLQAAGRRVCFVGDGINDSPALAQAQLGVALGTGTDIAAETAGIVLVRGDLCDVLNALELCRVTLRRIHWNFLWAGVYNLLAIPVAAGALYPWVKMTLPPAVAAAAMGLSSVSVILSSLCLQWYRRQFSRENLSVASHGSDDEVSAKNDSSQQCAGVKAGGVDATRAQLSVHTGTASINSCCSNRNVVAHHVRPTTSSIVLSSEEKLVI